ncbi:hypothetical protein EC991_010995 [Linnemannia zychae]|nr:hypothetical protein EC991_010995 [Linnemannia zychae]
MTKVSEFLTSDRKVFLLLGASGAGKSMFTRQLEYTLWDNYKHGDPIPLYVNLPDIDKPEKDLISKELHSWGFSADQILVLKETRDFVLICDGYDESQLKANLYTANCLNQPGRWRAKVVISCRTQWLGVDYRSRFLPYDNDHYSRNTAVEFFQEVTIAPFTKAQILEYVEQYVVIEKSVWSAKEFMENLRKIPNLLDLVSNPFLLTLALRMLPGLSVDAQQSLKGKLVTRAGLYDAFVEKWLETNKLRQRVCSMSEDESEALEQLCDEGFEQEGIEFSKRLAASIYKEQGGRPVVNYPDSTQPWKQEFLGSSARLLHLRMAVPLCGKNKRYRFLHQSLLEYFYSRVFFDPPPIPESNSDNNHCGNLDSDEESIHAQAASSTTTAALLDQPLNKICIVKELAVLDFLVDRVKNYPAFQTLLIDIVELSKTEPLISTAAANAMTILVRARVKFHGKNLCGIKVPGADLSGGLFDLTDFQGADLRRVDFTRAWMRAADLRGAQMDDVEFGELPYLNEEVEVRSCAYSPDGRRFATGCQNGTVNIYDTNTWRRMVVLGDCLAMTVNGLAFSTDSQHLAAACGDGNIRVWSWTIPRLDHVLRAHNRRVNCVDYSSDGHHIASGSDDGSVILWDCRTGKASQFFNGHTGSVNGVAFSPDGTILVTVSADCTVRIWTVDSGEAIIVGKHADQVTSVAFSPLGHQVVTGSYDKTVRVWNLDLGVPGLILKEHTGQVWSVAYSHDGYQIASGGQDCSIRLWNARVGGKATVTLDGHIAGVCCVRYSPSQGQIASAGSDCHVRLWNPSDSSVTPCSPDVESLAYSPDGVTILCSSSNGTLSLWDAQTGTAATGGATSLGAKICGHEGEVRGAVFSPDGFRIVSCGVDRAVRIWDAESRRLVKVLEGHQGSVLSVAYSPTGCQVASCSDDGTIRLWDARTGAVEKVLKGQSDTKVHAVAYSPDEAQLASCSGDEITLWDINTEFKETIIHGGLGALMSIAYSPDGQYLAAAGSMNRVNIWSRTTGELFKSIRDPSGAHLFGVTYSPSGDWVATASSDKTLKLWDVKTQVCVLVLRGFSGLVTSVAWSSASPNLSEGEHRFFLQRLVTGSTDRAIRHWEIGKVVAGHDDGEVSKGLAQEKEKYTLRLVWGSGRRGLAIDEVRVFGVSGLSPSNVQLIQQRGARLL